MKCAASTVEPFVWLVRPFVLFCFFSLHEMPLTVCILYTLRLDQFFFHFRLKMKYLMRVNHDFRIINFICVFLSSSFSLRSILGYVFIGACAKQRHRVCILRMFLVAFVFRQPFLICLFHLCHQHILQAFHHPAFIHFFHSLRCN